MNARQHYTVAYRNYRASKGCVGLAGNNKAIVNAWKTYASQFWFTSESDMLNIWHIKQQAIQTREFGLAKERIRLMYCFASDFSVSKVSKL